MAADAAVGGSGDPHGENVTFFTSPGQFEYEGIIYTDGFPREVLDRIRSGEDWQLHPDDVLIATYPKSGTSHMM